MEIHVYWIKAVKGKRESYYRGFSFAPQLKAVLFFVIRFQKFLQRFLFGVFVSSCSQDAIPSSSLNQSNLPAASIIPNNKPSSLNKVYNDGNRDVTCRYITRKSGTR